MKSLLLFGCLAASAWAAETVRYVAPSGDDRAAGTRDAPFATLARGREAMGAWAKSENAGDFTLVLRGGTHALAASLALGPAELGDGRRRVTLRAESGERAIISGGAELTGTWESVEPTLWRLAVKDRAAIRLLTAEGAALRRAREPDAGHFSLAGIDAARRRITLVESLPPAWTGLAGVELHSTAWWHYNRQSVARLGEREIETAQAIGTDLSSSRMNDKSHTRLWLEGALPFADEPGEWFHDAAGGALFLRTAPGDDPNRRTFAAAAATELIVIAGTTDRPVRNVRVQGLEFAATDFVMPPGGRHGIQAGAWTDEHELVRMPTAALRLAHVQDATVEQCVFRDLGEGAIALEVGARRVAITRNRSERVGANVIQVGRMPAFRGATHPLHVDWQTPADAPSAIEIADNTLLDGAVLDLGSVGIWVGYANHVRILHNHLRGFPYTGISVGWRWASSPTNCHSIEIAGNRVEHVMRQVGDGAGIYLVGDQPGTAVRDNWVSDSGGNYWAHGLYADEASDRMVFERNFVQRTADHSIFLHKNGPNQIFRDHNGDRGPTAMTGEKPGRTRWVQFTPERAPTEPEHYGPRGER